MSYVIQVVPRVKHMSYGSIEAAQNWDVSERHLIVVSQVVPRVKHMSYASIEAAQNWDVSERHLIVVSQVVPRVKHAISRRETGSLRETVAGDRRAARRFLTPGDIRLRIESQG